MSPLGATTTPDDDLFFSSPGLHSTTQRDPQDEVQELIDTTRTRNMAGLSPALSSFMALHKPAFLEMFNRQLQLIRSRSQAFEDAHITIFDKVLLNLTQNGTDLDNPAAIQYYCEEYLGINTGASCEETSRVLHQTIDVPQLLMREMTGANNPRETARRSLVPEPETSSSDFVHLHRTGEKQQQDKEPQVARLLQVYERAKADYFAVSSSGSGIEGGGTETIEAAKFLRDTAENTLQYLSDKIIDPNALTELQSTFNMAKATVVSLSGGKKRKFDTVEMDSLVRAAPRGPGGGGGTNASGYGSHGAHAAGRRRSNPNPNPYPSKSSDSGYGGYTYEGGAGAGTGRDIMDRDRDRDRDRSDDEACRSRSASPRGRRRSYGYSRREVDSYKPRK
ncbi:hypothetical protein LTR99_004315 [Exophiala xenobiotica]|uniref:Uncharacterized protein n=1 Tax=Vermiconidia calcicola TaxID=1690605 RepID=A0AAV9QB25_9PEZI|nr:hypothetical protein LTR99_004315 [Exophiala xenobiotica]KAK5338471.1 hypothetical protein LTR98_004870 [Exophiala xenobiotica]KAK5432552.1 hypothetical protein LTR34_004024 [Exophiala xenobiotica]KAK5446833.1 hypothetical protein LTR18_002411 [Exophiala xenobiotica]KAK5539596.1 hypothetical protein LTR25_003300 [Vermiconidia calcicola]